jgi:diguanylate cyclase (GGDEF)-like protein
VATALRGHEARIESFYQSRTTYDHRPPAKPLSITFANLILYFVPSNVRQHPKTRGAISTIGQEPSRSNRVLPAPLCRASHPLLSSWYIPANQNVTKGLFTLARMTGIVKSHRVYSTKLSASCRMAMETKSIASVGQARFDSLVGLYSREAILGKLGELVGLAAHPREDLSLNLLEIDRFEAINDDYGHLTAERVLAKTATSIRRNIRQTDMVTQYGRGEFLIVLPGTSLSSSWAVAERLRSLIEKAKIKSPAGHAFTITVSQGLVGWEHDEGPASLVSRAEEALRKAREKGRNRVQILLGPSLRGKT